MAHRRLGRTTGHRQSLFRNMLSALIVRDRIETTLFKAKELQPLADRMITLAKGGTLAKRRMAFSMLRDEVALKKLFTTLVDRYRERKGGYTRILKLGHRHGDSAPMAIIEYLTAELRSEAAKADKSAGKKAKKKTKD